MESHPLGVDNVALSPDGQHILTSYTYIRLWDREGNLVQTLPIEGDFVWSALFNSDSSRILTTSGDNHVRLWDINGDLVQDLPPYDYLLVKSVFADGGRKVLSLSLDGVARLWDLSQEAMRVVEHGLEDDGYVTQAAASPAGGFATSTRAGVIRIWNSQGELVRLLPGNGQPIQGLVFSPAGDRILTLGQEGAAILWPGWPEEPQPLDEALHRLRYLLTADECLQYLGPSTCAAYP
jgi:WD40 repeat protein